MIKTLEEAGHLDMLHAPQDITIDNQQLTLDFQLPRQGVSLVVLKKR